MYRRPKVTFILSIFLLEKCSIVEFIITGGGEIFWTYSEGCDDANTKLFSVIAKLVQIKDNISVDLPPVKPRLYGTRAAILQITTQFLNDGEQYKLDLIIDMKVLWVL